MIELNFPIENSSEQSYESTLLALNKLIKIVENPSTSLDDLRRHVQEADQLFEQCKKKLSGLENDLNNIL